MFDCTRTRAAGGVDVGGTLFGELVETSLGIGLSPIQHGDVARCLCALVQTCVGDSGTDREREQRGGVHEGGERTLFFGGVLYQSSNDRIKIWFGPTYEQQPGTLCIACGPGKHGPPKLQAHCGRSLSRGMAACCSGSDFFFLGVTMSLTGSTGT